MLRVLRGLRRYGGYGVIGVTDEKSQFISNPNVADPEHLKTEIFMKYSLTMFIHKDFLQITSVHIQPTAHPP